MRELPQILPRTLFHIPTAEVRCPNSLVRAHTLLMPFYPYTTTFPSSFGLSLYLAFSKRGHPPPSFTLRVVAFINTDH